MTIWLPDPELPTDRPRYLAIVDAIADAISDGALTPGDRLPTHRALAYHLGVTVGTVTRAYSEAMTRGLAVGEVGRGTFVADKSAAEGTLTGMQQVRPIDTAARFTMPDQTDPSLCDLSLNFVPDCGATEAMQRSLRTLSTKNDPETLTGYRDTPGRYRHREAGASWIGRRGWTVSPDRVLITAGAQNGLALALTALCDPGDVVLTESPTYPGVKAASELFSLRLQGVAMDRDGILPEAFEEACRQFKPRAAVLVPTLHNPTSYIMSDARRQRIAELARKYDVLIVEDDVYGHFPVDAPPPLASYAPEQSLYLTGASKTLAPGLRIGYLIAPPSWAARLSAALHVFSWMASPIAAGIAADWIETGVADKILEKRREEVATRRALAFERLPVMPEDHLLGHEASFYLWLRLPEPWRYEAFTMQARQHGVAVTPPNIFAIGRTAPEHAVRICLGATEDPEELGRGLSRLSEVLAAPESPLSALF